MDPLALYASVFEEAPVGFVVCDGGGTIVLLNRRAQLMFGYSSDELLGQPIEALVPSALRGAHIRLREKYSQDPTVRSMGEGRDLFARCKDGAEIPIEIGLAAVSTDSEHVVVASIEDISLRRKAEVRLSELTAEVQEANRGLERLATTDPLTRVLNRRGLERTLAREAAHAARSTVPMAALMVDCDDFKKTNDEHGHAAGDAVLRTVATELLRAVRPADHVARIGGDEFLVLLPETRIAEAARVGERVRMTVASARVRVGDAEVRQTISIGIAGLPATLSSADELLALTRLGLQRSKRAGKNRVASSGADLVESGREGDDDLVRQLLTGEGIHAVAQGIYSLAESRVVGYEMLSRCRSRSFEMPADFFSMAREANVLAAVDLQCLRRCLTAASALEGTPRLHLNLFPSTLLSISDDELAATFPTGENGADLCIELSEQQLIGDPSSLEPVISTLRDSGVKLAVDDAGFGRSSLEALILLEPEIVKLDRSYVSGVAHDSNKRKALSRLVRAIKALRSTVVAKGVETAEDLAILRDMNVDLGQGFLWGEPATPGSGP